MKRTIRIIPLCLLLSVPVSCAKETGGEDEKKPESKTAVISASNDYWTYFSFETGGVVGTGALISEEDDEAWAARTDWDFAICRDMIKTNSGTSGNGKGGIIRMDGTEFGEIRYAPESGYQTDSDDVAIR